MIFAIICTDMEGALDTRKANREKHLEYLGSIGSALKGAGPFIDAYGKPNGSMLIVEMADQQRAEQFAANDPYALAGLFSSVEIRPWNWLLANPYQGQMGDQ